MLQIVNPRIVIDTNLWVSYFLWHETKARLKQILFDESLTLLISEALVEEISVVLSRPKFRNYFSLDKVALLQESLRLRAELIETHSVIALSRDQKDDFMLLLCLDGAADFLLTGDADLLVMQPFGNTQILKLTEFWGLYSD
jgi:putative PIN family toxin of toxin-antitoxin system